MAKKTSTHILHLEKDPIMAALMKAHILEELPKSPGLFQDVVENILGQQLSSKAARTITKRFVELFEVKKFPTGKQILSMPDEKIRACGTSWSKIKYIKNFCQAVESGNLKLKEVESMSDEEVVIELTKIKGIGPWTAQMILMFSLNRPDVFSIGDLGLRTAVSKHYKVSRDDLKKILKISQKWSPYRTKASLYLWKSLDAKK